MNIISVKPAAITLVEPEIILLDFGRAAFAGLELELNGKTGQNIEVALGEVLTNGRLNRNPGGSRCIKIIPLTLQAGVHRYHVEIPQHKAQNPALPKLFPPQEAGGEIAPFRYVEISGYAGEVDARQ
ncbi:MAG: family 78 glycoside hydrolase catalytic domain, partial [Lentisphaerota bacterium]